MFRSRGEGIEVEQGGGDRNMLVWLGKYILREDGAGKGSFMW